MYSAHLHLHLDHREEVQVAHERLLELVHLLQRGVDSTQQLIHALFVAEQTAHVRALEVREFGQQLLGEGLRILHTRKPERREIIYIEIETNIYNEAEYKRTEK